MSVPKLATSLRSCNLMLHFLTKVLTKVHRTLTLKSKFWTLPWGGFVEGNCLKDNTIVFNNENLPVVGINRV